MRMLFIEYPPCSTCKKAKKYLQEAGMDLQTRHIVEETPTVEELRTWVKDRLKDMSEEEQLHLLSRNGMLIKRPLLICEKGVAVGFKEDNYKNLCSE